MGLMFWTHFLTQADELCALAAIRARLLGKAAHKSVVFILGTLRATLVVSKFWLRLLSTDSSELIKLCYEWQMENLKVDSWAKKLKE
jgi:hypothetical protein